MKKSILFTFIVACFLVLIIGNMNYKDKLNTIINKAMIAQAETNKKEEKILALVQLINKDIPGFVAWGDSLTAGAGGEGITYPNVLQGLIKKNIYSIPIVNMGVGGENTKTIIGRAGSVPFEVDKFTIPEDKSKVKISMHSSDGSVVAPLRQGDGGINPVTIAGVEGNITIEQESSISKDFRYYFQRTKTGETVYVKDDTTIMTDSQPKYENYIPIVFMGQNGGYLNNQDLINQINSILEMDKANDKYLVLGLTTGDKDNRKDIDESMEKEYGDRYLNLREYLSVNGLEIAGITPTEEDEDAMEIGSVPPSLLADDVHFNSDGYEVIGHAVYERLSKLGYFEEIKKIVKQIDEM